MTTDETLQIDTPENVIFDYAVSGIGSRFLAALVDTTLIVLIQVIILTPVTYVINRINQESEVIPTGWLVVLISLIGFLFFWGFYIFFELAWAGQSPGKRWVGLRVIRTDGTPVTLTESIIRNLVRLVDFMPFGYGFGLITMFVNDQSRRLGDLAAGTLVVHDRPVETIQMLTDKGRLGNVANFYTSFDLGDFPLEQLNPREIEVIEEYIHRREQIGPAQANILAKRIVSQIYTRLGLPEPVSAIQQDVLVAILKAVRAQQAE